MRPTCLMLRWSALGLTVLTACCGSTAAESAGEYLNSGNRYAADRRYSEAIIEYRNAIAADPKLGTAHARLAEAYLETNDSRNAVRELVIAADLLPQDARIQIQAGQLLLLMGYFDDARTRALNALAIDPRNVEAQVLKGNASARLQYIDTAIAHINEAIALDPEDPRGHASLGALELEKGRLAEAEAAFKRAVEVDPKSAHAHMALANFYWSTNRFAEAERPLERAIAIDPKSMMAQHALATFYIATNRLADAERPLKVLADTQRDDASKLALADHYVATKRLPEAVSILRQVAAGPSGFAEATLRLATIDYSPTRRTAGHQAVDAVLARQPKNSRAAMLKSRFLLTEGKVEDALAHARSAVAADPESAPAHYWLGSIQARARHIDEAIESFAAVIRINPRIGAAKLRLAELQLQKGSAPAAVDFAEQAVAEAPRGIEPRLILIRSLVANGDLRRAETLAQELLDDHPNVAEIHAQFGDILLARRESAGARKAYDRAAAIDPDSLHALRGHLQLDIEARNVSGARARIEREIAKSPKSAPLWFLSAAVHAAARDVAREEAALGEVIALDPSNPQAFEALAAIYVRTGRLDEARAEYERLIATRPKSVAALTMVGMILEAQRKPAEAQAAYERVVAQSPSAAVAANNLAWLYAERGGNLDMALQLAQTASSQLPKVAGVSHTLGWIYLKKNLPRLAIPALQSSIENDPKNALYHYHLGLAYAQAGDRDRARAAFDDALKLKPDYREASEARQGLASASRDHH